MITFWPSGSLALDLNTYQVILLGLITLAIVEAAGESNTASFEL